MVLVTGPNASYRPNAPLISAARMQFLERAGMRPIQISPDKKSISFHRIRFRLPTNGNFPILQDIARGLIFYYPSQKEISFYKKIISNKDIVHYEKIGGIKFDAAGYLLKRGRRFKSNGISPNYKNGQPCSVNVADFVDLFGVNEKNIAKSKFIIFGINVSLSANPHNIYYDALQKGEIYYQLRPSGKAIFFEKINGKSTYIGEVTKTQLTEHKKKTGKATVHLPDIIKKLNSREEAITWEYQKDGRSPCFMFQSDGIKYTIYVTEEMFYASDILNGNLYRREYEDHIEIGIKKRGKRFKLLGEISFNRQGQLLHGVNIFLKNGVPVTKNSGQIFSDINLKSLIPELATIEIPFKYKAPLSKKGYRRSVCRANAQKHAFYITAKRRNILIEAAKEGRITLRLTPEKISVLLDGECLSYLRKDSQGNILNHNGTIAAPFNRVEVNLTSLMPEIDIEEGQIGYIKGKQDRIQLRTKGITFISTIKRDCFFVQKVKRGEVSWKRTGKKVEIFWKMTKDPICFFYIRKDRIVTQDNKSIPIPISKRISLFQLAPIFKIHIGKSHKIKVESGKYFETTFLKVSKRPRQRAFIMNRLFYLGADPRNPYLNGTKKGIFKFHVYADEIHLIYSGKIIGKIKFDKLGNIVDDDGEVLIPASQKKVNLAALIPELDVEEGFFNVYRLSKHSYRIAVNIKGIRFRFSLDQNSLFGQDIFAKRICWRRTGNLVEILYKNIKEPIGRFKLDLEKREVISEEGSAIKISDVRNQSIKLLDVVPSLNTKIGEKAYAKEDVIEIFNVENGKDIFAIFKTLPLPILFAMLTSISPEELPYDSKLITSRYMIALNIFLDRIRKFENGINRKTILLMAHEIVRIFIEIYKIQHKNAVYIHLLRTHKDAIRDYVKDIRDKDLPEN